MSMIQSPVLTYTSPLSTANLELGLLPALPKMSGSPGGRARGHRPSTLGCCPRMARLYHDGNATEQRSLTLKAFVFLGVKPNQNNKKSNCVLPMVQVRISASCHLPYIAMIWTCLYSPMNQSLCHQIHVTVASSSWSDRLAVMGFGFCALKDIAASALTDQDGFPRFCCC